MQKAGWSCESTFVDHYLRDVNPTPAPPGLGPCALAHKPSKPQKHSARRVEKFISLWKATPQIKPCATVSVAPQSPGLEEKSSLPVLDSADLDFLNSPPSPLKQPASLVTNAVLPPPPGWEDPVTPPRTIQDFLTGSPLDLDILTGDSEHLLSHLDSAIQSDLIHTGSDITTLLDDHDQPRDLFCKETLTDLSPKDDHLAPPVQTVKKKVKVHRVTLHKIAGGVQFLVDPPLPNSSSSQQVIPLLPSGSANHFVPIPIPHPIDAKEAQVVELKTTDLDTPVHTYENKKGEKVFEFQIPPVTPEGPPMNELHDNLASPLVTQGEPTELSNFDSSTRPLFRVTPGPPFQQLLTPP